MGGNKEFAILVQPKEPLCFHCFVAVISMGATYTHQLHMSLTKASSRPETSDILVDQLSTCMVNSATKLGALKTADEPQSSAPLSDTKRQQRCSIVFIT